MKLKLLKAFVLAFTLATIACMSISAQNTSTGTASGQTDQQKGGCCG